MSGKKIMKTSLAAVLAASAIVPVASAEAAQQFTFEKVVVAKDGKNLEISFDLFNELLGDVVSTADLRYVTDNAGNHYDLALFNEYLSEYDGDFDKTITALAEAKLAVTDVTVQEGFVNDKGELVGKDETPSTELKVASVSAINANLVQVTLSNDVPTGLTKENIVISNGVNVEALTVSGKTLTLTTSTLPANRDLTLTFKGVEALDKATGTFKYNQAVNLETAVEGFVYVPKLLANGKQDGNKVVPGVGVTVTAADGTTTKTDANGYYKLPAQVGSVEVTVEAPGNYINQTDVIVSAEKSTAHIVSLQIIDADYLQVTGAVKDNKTGSIIEGAKVELQEKVNGSWVTIDERTSAATTGAYKFNNSKADSDSTNRFKDIYGDDTNRLKANGEYRIVVSKAGVVAATTAKPYHTLTQEFKLSKKGPETKQAPLLTEVKNIEKLTVDFEYTDADVTASNIDTNATKEKVKFTLLDSTGKKLVDSTNLSEKETVAAVTLTASNGKYTGSVNIAELTASTNLYLKTGTYFLKVDDGKSALQVFEVKVTEGQDHTSTKFVSKKAAQTSVTSTFKEIPTDFTGTIDDALFQVYKTVNGVDVLVTEIDNAKYAISTDSLTTKEQITRLEEAGYKVTISHPYILGTPSVAVNAKAETVPNQTLDVEGAGVLVSSFDLLDADGTTLKALTGYAKRTIPFEVSVKNAAGTVVAKEKVNLIVDKDGKIVKDENSQLQFVATASGVVQASPAGTETQIGVVVPKLLPADYTVTLDNLTDDFKDVTNEKTKVNMFEGAAATVNTDPNVAKTAKLVATPAIKLAGSVLNSDNTPKTITDVRIFDATTGAELVEGTDFVNYVPESGKYSIEFATKVTSGKYKVVYYGPKITTGKILGNNTNAETKIETFEKVIDLVKGDNTQHVTVTKGGEGKLELNIFDETGKRLDTSDVTLTVTDAYATEFNFATLTNGYTKSDVALSKGDYKVKINAVAGTNYKSAEHTVTLDRINGTVLKTLTVDLVSKGKTFAVGGKITSADITAAADVKVVIFNASTGELVQEIADASKTVASGSAEYTTLLSNGSYIVKAFVNGNYVASKEIEVKDRAVTGVDISTTKTQR